MNSTTYAAQTKLNRNDTTWVTVAERSTIVEAAKQLRDHMEREGFRHGELSAHVTDLLAGHTLWADNGASFRVVEQVAELVACPVSHQSLYYAEHVAAHAELDRKRAALAELGWDDAQIDAAIAAAERRLCRHPRSCAKCARLDVPCGAHVVGTVGHERCTGRA